MYFFVPPAAGTDYPNLSKQNDTHRFVMELSNDAVSLISQLLHFYRIARPVWMEDFVEGVFKEFADQNTITHYKHENNRIYTEPYTHAKPMIQLGPGVWHVPLKNEPKKED